MKTYLKDLPIEKRIDLILNNNELSEIIYQEYYEYNMDMQLEEGELMFGKNSYEYIDIRDHYSSFYLRLKNWYKFIENLDKDYLCDKGLELYNEIIELKKQYENIDMEEEEERFNELSDQLENMCEELLDICEKQLHEYENINEEDLKDWLEFKFEDNEEFFGDYYILNNDNSKIYLDITKEYE